MKRIIFLLFLLVSVKAFSQKAGKRDHLITIKTDFGEIVAILYDETPMHKSNFIHLTDTGFYNGTIFHRVIEEFMIQGGDPRYKKSRQGTMSGTPDIGYQIPAEINERFFHKKGAIAAAHNNNPQRASNGCQFYIVQGKVFDEQELRFVESRAARPFSEEQKQVYKSVGGAPHLDGSYTVFGEVLKGFEVIDEIARQPRTDLDRPLKDVTMIVTLKKVKKKKIEKSYGYKY